jgi:hypothetical protein
MSVPTPPDGFAEFVVSRSPALLRTALLLTGDAGKAEHLLQTPARRRHRSRQHRHRIAATRGERSYKRPHLRKH